MDVGEQKERTDEGKNNGEKKGKVGKYVRGKMQ
jgi:hypothetical protein